MKIINAILTVVLTVVPLSAQQKEKPAPAPVAEAPKVEGRPISPELADAARAYFAAIIAHNGNDEDKAVAEAKANFDMEYSAIGMKDPAKKAAMLLSLSLLGLKMEAMQHKLNGDCVGAVVRQSKAKVWNDAPESCKER
jgi:hypothetical protein